MKRMICFLIIFCILAGCSSGAGGDRDKQVVAQINGYKMTVEDLKDELKNVPYDEKRLMDTEEGRKGYLDRLIKKQALLQEAQRQWLDRDKAFMKTIERYWEQALLKNLLEKKTKEIAVSMDGKNLKRAEKQEKETEAMNNWIEGLVEKSDIEINKEAVEAVFLGGGYDE